ncbi:MAG: hypothetical protein GY913_20465 [Proteobacteria bacterium]|nr:hypothetical protein [Pseudomonadota bacterium]MCP4919282.1 hypothetical protein [Pseudomonadota bacterium]
MDTPERLTACPECACFVRAEDTSCPHCGATRPAPSATPALSTTAAALMVGLASTGCIVAPGGDSDVVALYGVADTSAFVDNDGDGFSTSDGDCDDTDDTIHPDAEEIAGDGVDQNCNDDDDT